MSTIFDVQLSKKESKYLARALTTSINIEFNRCRDKSKSKYYNIYTYSKITRGQIALIQGFIDGLLYDPRKLPSC